MKKLNIKKRAKYLLYGTGIALLVYTSLLVNGIRGYKNGK